MNDDLLRRLGEREHEVQSQGASASTGWQRPFEGEERATVLDAVVSQVRAQRDAETRSAPAAAKVRRIRARHVLATTVLAAAAAAILVVGLGGDRHRDARALPQYAASRLEGGPRVMRSADRAASARLELAPDDRIDWVFAPETPVRQAVGAVLLASSAAGERRLARLSDAAVSDRGAVKLAGRLSDLVRLSPGVWRMTVLIGDPQTLPETAADATGAGPWSQIDFEIAVVASR
ncbi:MAG: hypothetical protein AAF721_21015 [Myxococcota bacterium]